MPDPYSLSQILRGAGSFLDRRNNANLVRICLKGKWLTMSHQTDQGRRAQAQRDLEYFYDYWVKIGQNVFAPQPARKNSLTPQSSVFVNSLPVLWWRSLHKTAHRKILEPKADDPMFASVPAA